MTSHVAFQFWPEGTFAHLSLGKKMALLTLPFQGWPTANHPHLPHAGPGSCAENGCYGSLFALTVKCTSGGAELELKFLVIPQPFSLDGKALCVANIRMDDRPMEICS